MFHPMIKNSLPELGKPIREIQAIVFGPISLKNMNSVFCSRLIDLQIAVSQSFKLSLAKKTDAFITNNGVAKKH